MIRTQRYGIGESVQVAMVYENGVPVYKTGKDADGLANLVFWADVSLNPIDPSDYSIDAVYAGDDYGYYEQELDGQAKADAIDILKSDATWCEWAQAEIRSRRRAA
jgi:hypothetical protein